MPTFITIGYGDESGYHRLSDDRRRAAHARVQVRNPDGAGVQIEPGPFLRSALPIAGFAVIEAEDLDAAIERVSQTPCAMAHGVVEVWPLRT